MWQRTGCFERWFCTANELRQTTEQSPHGGCLPFFILSCVLFGYVAHIFVCDRQTVRYAVHLSLADAMLELGFYRVLNLACWSSSRIAPWDTKMNIELTTSTKIEVLRTGSMRHKYLGLMRESTPFRFDLLTWRMVEIVGTACMHHKLFETLTRQERLRGRYLFGTALRDAVFGISHLMLICWTQEVSCRQSFTVSEGASEEMFRHLKDPYLGVFSNTEFFPKHFGIAKSPDCPKMCALTSTITTNLRWKHWKFGGKISLHGREQGRWGQRNHCIQGFLKLNASIACATNKREDSSSTHRAWYEMPALNNNMRIKMKAQLYVTMHLYLPLFGLSWLQSLGGSEVIDQFELADEVCLDPLSVQESVVAHVHVNTYIKRCHVPIYI